MEIDEECKKKSRETSYKVLTNVTFIFVVDEQCKKKEVAQALNPGLCFHKVGASYHQFKPSHTSILVN